MKISVTTGLGDLLEHLVNTVTQQETVTFIDGSEAVIDISAVQSLMKKGYGIATSVEDLKDELVALSGDGEQSKIPLIRPILGKREWQNVVNTIADNWISSTGNYIAEFEQAVADYCCCEHAIAVSNCTTALHLSLFALGIGEGDEVILPAFSFISSANAIVHAGATPVFVDCTSDNWTIDASLIEEKITPKTKAIMPVHIYGHCADMDAVNALAKKHNLFVVEDAAESLGAEYKGKRCGALGDAGCFSFFGNKMITTGEGGMITTNNAELAESLRVLRAHGMDPKERYVHRVMGYNYRLTNLQAAVGVAQMERVEGIVEARRQNAAEYNKLFESVQGITPVVEAEWAKNVFWLYGIKVDSQAFGLSAEELGIKLGERGIETRPFFPGMHKQPLYLSDETENLSVTEMLSSRGLSLPTPSLVDPHSIKAVVEAIIAIQEASAN